MFKKENKTAAKVIPRAIIKEQNKDTNMPVNLLLSFALTTTCVAIAVKCLKRSELALLTGLMITPLVLMKLKEKHAVHTDSPYV